MNTLGDLAIAIVDCEHKTAPEGDGYALSVGTRAMKAGRLLQDACKPVSRDTYERWTRRLEPEPGDLILAREAPVGDVVWVPETPRVCLGQRTVLIRPDSDAVVPRFLHYWLLGPTAQRLMASIASGATVPHLNVADIRSLDVTDMPKGPKVQANSSIILGAIDDLIDNSRRRIQLLESMARAIYREWFVHFRYPGHDDDPLVDSPIGPIPGGWSWSRLDEIATVIRGRSYCKADLVAEGGLPFINLKCMKRGGGFRRDGLKRYAGKYKEQQLTAAGDIVLAVTDLTQGREILARATLVPTLQEPNGVISLDVARVVPNRPDESTWLFATLRWSNYSNEVKEFANGSTVLHLAIEHVAAGMIPLPPTEIRSAFSNAIAPLLRQIDILSFNCGQLSSLRDLLLPKLVTGRIDVAELSLDTVGAAP